MPLLNPKGVGSKRGQRLAVPWTTLSLLSAFQTFLYFMRDGRPAPWTPILVDRLADWYTCAIFTPLFFGLVRAVP